MLKGNKITRYFSHNAVKVLFIILIIGLSIIRMMKEDKPYPTGDAIEYTLMTEAFYNHFSPEVKKTDYDTFKQAYTKTNKWEENEKAVHYDAVGDFLQKRNLKNLDYNYAFFVDKQGRKYSAHFWFYSLLNLPARSLCAIVHFNPILVFHITNFFLIIFSCFVFFKTSKFKPLETGMFCLLFFYSTNYWYFCWPHPEVFTVCFASVGLWLFFHERWYLGILLISIASLQNQPLAILPVTLSIIVLFKNGFNFNNLIKLFFSSFLILAPPIFYFYHYGTTNLIGFQGALSFGHITFTRVFGFFFDINQGMILALPLILLIYFLLYIRKLYKIKSATTKWDLLIFPTVIIIVCGASTIDNWNHGQASVNRYVTYVGAVILVCFFFLVKEITNQGLRQFIIVSAVITQMITVYYHQTLNIYEWSTNEPKPISNWVLSHFPTMYNPDPTIFNSRYAEGLETDPAESPTYFMKENGEITKFLVHRKHLNNLQKYGLPTKQIDSIAETLKYINDWAYLDITGKLKLSISYEELKKIDNEKRISKQVETIKASQAWYEAVKKKALEKGISENDMLREDAAYVLKISLPAREKTKNEKINEKTNEIKSSPSWLKLIQEKATKLGISLDSAVNDDARWSIEQESK